MESGGWIEGGVNGRWPEVEARCEPCGWLLHLLLRGWNLPREDAVPLFSEDLPDRHKRWWWNRHAGRIPDYAPDPPSPGPGRPRLHRYLTPDAVHVQRLSVAEALEHLEGLAVEALEGHFRDSYGTPWPPHLEEVHGLLVDRWRRGGEDVSPGRRAYERRSTALRVLTRLPLEVDVVRQGGAVVSVTYRPCHLTYRQLHDLDKRAPEEKPVEGVRVTMSGPWPAELLDPDREEP